MRGISREVLARDAACTLGDGNCKELTRRWSAWEAAYLNALAVEERAQLLIAPAAVCAGCPITAECADLAELSLYTGIAAGIGYRNGAPDTYRTRDPFRRTQKPA